ncbi:Trimethylamine methyltransferase [Desulfamplus magnetovallimortis]|uniref:Trimethylamine methyltransferase n=1 Tax=Desulfamplus magnetovallimortis TaxID=1246637 RepID=A0A1W1H873_9BACT|nr:trimethylamine methyltransferase family protein [Desulfamplus magnetovallimortis]SLM28585.1 Trimethylamine methyltransferase [Desulfamplus magnetovallimortis]
MISSHGQSMTSAHYARMGENECRQIHMGTLEILERTGVDVHHEKAREILAAAGASVDGIRVRIPEYMVTRALAQAPERLTLYNRNKKPAIRAWGYNTYYGGGSDCLNILDHSTGERRLPLLSDVVEAAKVMDSLPEIDFVMSLFLPNDVDQSIYDRYQMEVMLNHTTKPIVFVTPDFEGCVAAVEMCEAVAGGEENFRRHPFATCYINVTSGLIANEEALQKCIYLAEKGLPQLWIPLNAGGVNSPATTAGCMANMNAGIMLGVVLSQLVRPGSPIAMPGWNGGPYNLQTMVGNYVLADEQGVPTTMGRYYNLPVFGLGGSTDSKVLDQQAGIEMTISLMTALMHGANIVHDVGFMESGLQGSLQLQVMANETIGFLRAATRGVTVDEETLALDVTDEMGPSGTYLQHPHTIRHYKEPFYSKLFDKSGYSQWEKKGSLTMGEKAAKVVDDILAAYKPKPLPEDVQQKIKAIVKREQEWIDSKR